MARPSTRRGGLGILAALIVGVSGGRLDMNALAPEARSGSSRDTASNSSRGASRASGLERAVLEVEEAAGTSEGNFQKRTWSGHYYIDFPDKYKDIFQEATHLGSGSFGESWLVTDERQESRTRGEKVVIKLMYIESGGSHKHLTWGLVKLSNKHWPKVMEAALECEIAQKIQAQGKELAARGTPHIGAMRIMGCYGHNVPMTTEAEKEASKDADAPLYLVLENCGAKPLTDYVNEKAADRDLMMNLFKQLLEGLDFMANLSPPWIHHDLKPDNVVVKRESDGSHTLHLIDFGATRQITKKDKCTITPSTGVYAPMDWQYSAPSCVKRRVCNFRTSCGERCGTAFDMFAAGVIFVEMAWTAKTRHCQSWDHAAKGQRCYKIMADLDNAYNRDREELNYPQFEQWGKSHQSALKRLIGFHDTGPMSKVFNAVAQTLRTHPGNRPTAATLLALNAFVAIKTPGAATEEDHEESDPTLGSNNEIVQGQQEDAGEEGENDQGVADEGQALVGAKTVLKELESRTGMKEVAGPRCPKVINKKGVAIECNSCEEAMEMRGKRNVRKTYFLRDGTTANAVVCLVMVKDVSYGFKAEGDCKPHMSPSRGFYKVICAEPKV